MTLGSALNGILKAEFASIYRLSRLSGFQIPISPIANFKPGLTGNHVSIDLVDNEDVSVNYTVTENTLQDFSNATSNVHRNLRRFTITGIMGSTIDVRSFIGTGDILKARLKRLDLVRIENLYKIADRGEPVMAITPRFSLKQCFIESINRPWSPDIGPNTELTVSFVEARILGPELGVGLPDYDSQLPGNGTQAGGGNVAGFPSITSETASTTPGLAPF
jgi:hypothetical protein